MNQPQVYDPPTRIIKYLLIVLLSGLLLYFGSMLFIPFFFGLLLALVMYPICRWLEARGWRRSLAITLVLMIVFLIFAALVFLLVWQVQVFKEDVPEVMRTLNARMPKIEAYIEKNFNIAVSTQRTWVQNFAHTTESNSGSYTLDFLRGTASTLFLLFMAPIFTALFLYHRGVFVKALHLFAGARLRPSLNAILKEIVDTYFNYVKGMIMVYVIVGVLNSIGLAALGIRHALLFGMLTAIMTIIPYVGIIISALLPISVAFITKDSLWYPLGVIGIFSFVQYLEGNVIFPKVVGKQLNVSTWATLVAILAGGVVWGVSGMILFIPFVAIFKIATDHVEEWKGANILLSREHEYKGR